MLVPGVLGGKDLEAGGTWLGVTRGGRFAAVTNVAETQPLKVTPPGSRGTLTLNFLSGSEAASCYARNIQNDLYRGFNLLLFDGNELVYCSNRAGDTAANKSPHNTQAPSPEPVVLTSGVYGLSNSHLDGEWPKVTGGKAALRQALATHPGPHHTSALAEQLLEVLADKTVPPDEELPQRAPREDGQARDLAFERRLTPRFILGEEYGTRASTVVIMKPLGGPAEKSNIIFVEQTFAPGGVPEQLNEFRFSRISETASASETRAIP